MPEWPGLPLSYPRDDSGPDEPDGLGIEGQKLQDPVYHVVLHGRKVGPYDRRTIVGMRIKKALANEDAVITADGVQLTVGDLVKARSGENTFQPNRSGSYSLVQATFSVSLVEVRGDGVTIPDFKDEIEARIQQGVLRMAGRFRDGLVGWKEDRVKVSLDEIVHARVRATLVDLWLQRADQKRPQFLTLELFSPEAAGEFVDWLPKATAWPTHEPAVDARRPGAHPLLWGAVVGTVMIVGAVLVWVLSHRGV